MPIPPPSITAPYDTLDSILNTTRIRMNDAIQSLGGEILADTQVYTQQMANDAWRKMQAFLANLGYSRLKNQFIGTAYPVVASTDPSSQTYLSWTNFFDGNSFYSSPSVVLIPQDFICPLRMWERQTGSNSSFQPMTLAPDGLPDCQKTAWNRFFEWREDAIYMPGSLYSMDLRVEYAAYLQDFITVGPVYWYQQPVPIMRCRSALANYIAAEASWARDDVDAQSFVDQAEMDCRLIFNNDVKMKQRHPVSRRPYGGRGGSWRLNGNSGY